MDVRNDFCDCLCDGNQIKIDSNIPVAFYFNGRRIILTATSTCMVSPPRDSFLPKNYKQMTL